MSQDVYEPYQRRVITEQGQVQDRLVGLNEFLNKGKPETMDDHEWDLLNSQAFFMRGYNYTLLQRIHKFNLAIKAKQAGQNETDEPEAVIG